MMSTLCNATPLAEAETIGEGIAAGLGCEGEDVAACLRATPVAKLIDADEVAWQITSGTEFLPRSPWEALQAGEFQKVPVLIGATRDEGRSFLTDWATRSVQVWDEAGYEQWVRDAFAEDAGAVLAVYPWPEEPTRFSGTYLVADLMIQNLIPDQGGLSPCKTSTITEVLASQVPTYAYEFAHADGSGWFEVPGYIWGAGHATELPYLIPNRGNTANNANAFGEEELQLAREMTRAWGAFAASGNPSVEDQPAWPTYQPGAGPVLQLRGGGESATVPAAALRAYHNCDFWDGVLE